MKEARIIKNARPHITINGKRYEPYMMHGGVGVDKLKQWNFFIVSFKMTLRGIWKGENYSISSCIMYYFKPQYR